MPRKHAKNYIEVKDKHWRNHINSLGAHNSDKVNSDLINTQSNHNNNKNKKSNNLNYENPNDYYYEYKDDFYDNSYNKNTKKNKYVEELQNSCYSNDYYNNYYTNNDLSVKGKGKENKNLNSKKANKDYFSVGQFFQNFVENNNFSYNPTLPSEENFDNLIKHLNIKGDKKQCDKLKEKLNKAKALEQQNSIIDNKKDTTDSNKIKSNEPENNQNIDLNTKNTKLNRKQKFIFNQFESYKEKYTQKENEYENGYNEENYENFPDYFEGEDLHGNFNDFEDYYDNVKKGFEESFSQNPYIDQELADYEEVSAVDSVAQFFVFYKKKYEFKIKKKFEPADFHLSNFYKLADYMKWTNMLSDKKLFFKQLDRDSKFIYLRKNFKKFNLAFNQNLPLKKNFLKLCEYMKWEDLYNLYYELFIDILNKELANQTSKKIDDKENSENEKNKENENKENKFNSKDNKLTIKNELTEEFIKILNEDLEKFESEISATEEENKRISKTVSLIEDFIRSYFPQCSMDPFGSFTQGLNLRDSDIDVAIFDKPMDKLLKESTKIKAKLKKDQGYNSPDKKLLGAIKKKLLRVHFSSYNNTQFINAKVPIVKTKCNKTGVNIDIR